MAVFPTAAAERLREYNSNAYDPATNPYGMALGGHRQNFPLATSDVAIVGEFVQAAAAEADASAAAAATSAGAAADARALSQRWAANPENVAVQAGLFSALHYAAKAQASAAAAAMFDPANFFTREQSNQRFYTKQEVDDARWPLAKLQLSTGPNLVGRLSGEGAPQFLTPAQIRSLLQSDDPSEWVTVAAVKLTASAAAIIIPVPAGRKSLRIQGLYRADPDTSLQGRISTDGGATYRATTNYYWSGQRTTQNGAGVSSDGGAGATSMLLGTNGRGNAALPTAGQIFAEFDENSCAQFIYNSVGSNSQGHRLISSGLSRPDSVAIPTHVMLFPSSGSFLAGTHVIAEAF